MILTISTTHEPASDLGFILHKNPNRVHTFALSFGEAHVFYPEADDKRCTAALLLDIDPVGLVRKKDSRERSLEQYVNDRPYIASSFYSVALGSVFRSALAGNGGQRQELADSEIPLEIRLSVLPARNGGEPLLRKLFGPLGYEIETEQLPLDDRFPDWGASPYFSITLRCTKRLRDALAHLYVLIPVLDNEKHYWVGDAEVEKLLRRGAGWLENHPEAELIAKRYLKYRRSLAREAIDRLVPESEDEQAEQAPESTATREEALEKPISLNESRYMTVIEVLERIGCKRVVDVGCGDGKFLRKLFESKHFDEIVGLDVSHRSLEIAAERLRLDQLPDRVRSRIKLIHGSLMYRDKRIEGFDVATAIEVIEHLDAARLGAFERVLFEFARPGVAVVTTPNVEYNVKFETLPEGQLRHPDHRFEWARSEFEAWANEIAKRFGYNVELGTIGEVDATVGPPTQMAVFTL